MTIRVRILLFVLLAEMGGYGMLVYFAHVRAAEALHTARTAQIEATLTGYLHRIEGMMATIARNADDLAVAGEDFYRRRQSVAVATMNRDMEVHLRRHFERMPTALGGGWWYEPFQFDPKRRLVGPYAFWQNNQVVFTWDLSSDDYNYPQQSWYLRGMQLLTAKTPGHVIWTAPYRDEAGSEALMMTVDALMFDGRQVIGMATVDWSLQAMRDFVATINITPNSFAFLIDKHSRVYVSFVADDNRVMQAADQLPWEQQLLKQSVVAQMTQLERVDFRDQPHRIYHIETSNGLILGVFVPEHEWLQELQPILKQNLLNSAILALLMISIGLLILAVLFRPFNRVLTQIQNSMVSDADDHLHLTPLRYAERNEFTPIIHALNRVYAEVTAYTQRLSQANQALAEQQNQLNELNVTLEQKVLRRTEELALKNDELATSLQTLRDTQEQLISAEKHGALNQLIAGVAHEINTPLGVAITAMSHLRELQQTLATDYQNDTLKRDMMNQFINEADESLTILQSNLNRATQLMRSFKQISVDQTSEASRSFNLASYINDVLLSLRPTLKKTPHQITVDCPPDLVITSFPGAWSQVLTNLIMNSLTHAFPDDRRGHMAISIRVEGTQLQCRYDDDGIGIAPEHLPHVFEPFFTTRRGQGGSGLGLHIVYNIVEQTLGGQIHCRSQPGDGVHMSWVIPLNAPNKNSPSV